jgi:hypothetical protein
MSSPFFGLVELLQPPILKTEFLLLLVSFKSFFVSVQVCVLSLSL